MKRRRAADTQDWRPLHWTYMSMGLTQAEEHVVAFILENGEDGRWKATKAAVPVWADLALQIGDTDRMARVAIQRLKRRGFLRTYQDFDGLAYAALQPEVLLAEAEEHTSHRTVRRKIGHALWSA